MHIRSFWGRVDGFEGLDGGWLDEVDVSGLPKKDEWRMLAS